LPTSSIASPDQSTAIYLLGPLAAVICFYAVYKLAREVTDPLTATQQPCSRSKAMHYLHFSVVKFAHDQVQLALLGIHWPVLLIARCGRSRIIDGR